MGYKPFKKGRKINWEKVNAILEDRRKGATIYDIAEKYGMTIQGAMYYLTKYSYLLDDELKSFRNHNPFKNK